MLQALAEQFVEYGQKRTEGLARAGRRGQQHRLACMNQRPGLGLGIGHRGEVATEPGAHGGVEQLEHRVVFGGQVHVLVMEGVGRVGKGPFVCQVGYDLYRPLRG
ncbi:hypothetical protein D3C75_897440 [compost metagenome]